MTTTAEVNAALNRKSVVGSLQVASEMFLKAYDEGNVPLSMTVAVALSEGGPRVDVAVRDDANGQPISELKVESK
jgi:hypothetical protein